MYIMVQDSKEREREKERERVQVLKSRVHVLVAKHRTVEYES